LFLEAVKTSRFDALAHDPLFQIRALSLVVLCETLHLLK